MKMFERFIAVGVAAVVAYVVFEVLNSVQIPVDNNAVWIGSCILASGFLDSLFSGWR